MGVFLYKQTNYGRRTHAQTDILPALLPASVVWWHVSAGLTATYLLHHTGEKKRKMKMAGRFLTKISETMLPTAAIIVGIHHPPWPRARALPAALYVEEPERTVFAVVVDPIRRQRR